MFRRANATTALLLVGLAATLLPCSARAAEGDRPAVVPPAQERPTPAPAAIGGWTPYRSELIAAGVVSTGMETRYVFGWKRPLSSGDSLLMRDAHVTLGIAPKINPSYTRVGPTLEVVPVAFLQLCAEAEAVQWFHTFGNLQSYSSPHADWADGDRAASAAGSYATRAFHATLEPTLRMKVGPVIARARVTAEWWSAHLHHGDSVFYASNDDILAPGKGWVITRTADLLAAPSDSLIAGARLTDTRALYRRGDYAPGDAIANPNSHRQLGALVAWTPWERTHGTLGRPTLFVFSGWYLAHRYRDRTPAMPNLIAGVQFEVDPSRR